MTRFKTPNSNPAAGEPVPLGDALTQLFAARGYGRVQANRQLRDIWRQVAGDETSAQTRVAGIRSGVLYIAVTNSALLGELVSFRKVELLAKLRSEHGDLRIRDIKFRIESRADQHRATE